MDTSSVQEIAALIELQGAKVLDVIDRTNDSTKYQVIGFQKPRLFIIDYRKKVNSDLNTCLALDDFNRFAYSFSSPAQMTLQKDADGDITLQLHDAQVPVPEYMVWIVVGLEGSYPQCPSVFQEIQDNDESSYSLITIYPLDRLTMINFMRVESNSSVAL